MIWFLVMYTDTSASIFAKNKCQKAHSVHIPDNLIVAVWYNYIRIKLLAAFIICAPATLASLSLSAYSPVCFQGDGKLVSVTWHLVSLAHLVYQQINLNFFNRFSIPLQNGPSTYLVFMLPGLTSCSCPFRFPRTTDRNNTRSRTWPKDTNETGKVSIQFLVLRS